LVEIPPTRSSEFHLVTGLLLPVWKHLPRAASKVYRLQTDGGERIVGRLIQTADVPTLRDAFNLDGAITLAPNDAYSALLDDGRPVSLRGGLGLRISTVMGARRIELTGFSDTEVEQLKSFGFFSEIIAWRLRLFLPLEAHAGAEALLRLFLLYPPL
jgi:protein strawberry notch